MPNTTPAIQSAAGGEISPRAYGRSDLAKYGVSHRVLENVIPHLIGAIVRRPGTRYIAATKHPSLRCALLDFEFSTLQAYVIEAGDGYFRFFARGGRVECDANTAELENGTFETGLQHWLDQSSGSGSISHDSTNDRLNLNGGGSSNEAIAENTFDFDDPADIGKLIALTLRVLGVAGDEIRLRIGSTAGDDDILEERVYGAGWHVTEFTSSVQRVYLRLACALDKTVQVDDVAIIGVDPFSSGPAAHPVELASPYVEADLAALQQHIQSRDVLFLPHPDHPFRQLVRHGDASWSLTDYAFQDGPWLEENIDEAKTLAPSATSGNGITITASGHEPFAPTDVGRLVRIKNGADWGWAIITAVQSSTAVTADVRSDFGATDATETWRLGLYSDTTGHPRAAAFHKERLVLAGCRAAPDRFDLSKVAAFDVFTPGTEDDDAIAAVIAGNKVKDILWLISGKDLFAGTRAGIARLFTDTLNAPLTPTNVQAEMAITRSSSEIRPVVPERSALFVPRHGKKLRDLDFAFDVDSYTAPDRLLLADHVAGPGIVGIDYQTEPWNLVWMRRSDGVLVSLTYEPEEKVFAAARQILGGGGLVESCAVIPGGGADELWLAVRRTINGQEVRYIELLQPPFGDETPAEDAFFVDSGLSYAGEPTTEIGGLDHLEGQTVRIMVDGAAHKDLVVDDGRITLDQPASKVHVGLPYRWTVVPNRPDSGSGQGTALGKRKRVAQLTLQLWRTGRIAVGPTVETAYDIPLRSTGDAMDTATPLFSGELPADFAGDWGSDGDIVLTHAGPFPATITLAVPHLEVEDG